MRIHTIGLAMILCLIFACSTALAEESGTSIPNLLGKWNTETFKVIFHKGEKQATNELQVKKQDGPYFRGIHTWAQVEKDKPMAKVGGKYVSKAAEPFVGVIGFDGKTIYIAEHGDWGVFHGRLVDPDTIEAVYVESGPAAAIQRHRWKRVR